MRTCSNCGFDEMHRRKQALDLSFLHQGITFTVYGEQSGTERIFPNDMLPRILTGSEWETIERGLTQRITALNLFLEDVYHEGKILKDRVVPPDMVYSCKHYRRQMRGVNVRRELLRHCCRHRPDSPARTAGSSCSKTTCASPAASPTCW